MNRITLADRIRHIDHLAAFDRLVYKRFSSLDLDKLLLYLIDTVPATVLPYLAEQFDVLGVKGIGLAKTETDEREIIKNAIRIKRRAGTPWAISEAIMSLGYTAVEIEERIPGEHWTAFKATINIGDRGVNATDFANITELIKVYKSARSHLLIIDVRLNLTDGFKISDSIDVNYSELLEDTISLGGAFRHDGQHLRDGSMNYSLDTDRLEIQIINV